MSELIDPAYLIEAYANGYFPMADDAADQEIYWLLPKVRGIIPIGDIHIPRSLLRSIKRGKFELRHNTAFQAVIENCAVTKKGREKTWINPLIVNSFIKLHDLGYAHSIESWYEGELVGGVYGLSLGGVFCGESMFSTMRDASKVALIALASRLYYGGYQILDAQFPNEHLKQFGCYEMDNQIYLDKLEAILSVASDFECSEYLNNHSFSVSDDTRSSTDFLLGSFLQSRSQTS